MRLADRRIGSISDIRPVRRQWTSAHIELELPPVHLREEAYSPLVRIMFQRVRIAGPVLPGNCGRSTPKTCPPSCMPASAAHLGLTIGCSCSSGPARPRYNLHCHAEVLILNHRHHRCLTGAPTLMKQLAPPPVQEQPALIQGRFLNFVEQRTRMDPSLRLGRVAKIYSHKQPSFHI
jgi:hypothetical protein